MKLTTYYAQLIHVLNRGLDMRIRTWTFAWWVRGSMLAVGFLSTLGSARGLYVGVRNTNQSASTSQQEQDGISQMASYIQQGRYDDAVQLGLQLLRNDPSDEVVYQQIADVYLIRAQKEVKQRDQWVAKAVLYVEKSLSFNSKEKDVAGVHLFQDARSFESAGDLSIDKRCTYYDRARKLLEDRVSLLQGDQITLAGRTFPLEPLRKENDRILAGVKNKATKAECK
jgi:tetratricopeptide (TPR) repeat protein